LRRIKITTTEYGISAGLLLLGVRVHCPFARKVWELKGAWSRETITMPQQDAQLRIGGRLPCDLI
jgi:hypothetical protein